MENGSPPSWLQWLAANLDAVERLCRRRSPRNPELLHDLILSRLPGIVRRYDPTIGTLDGFIWSRLNLLARRPDDAKRLRKLTDRKRQNPKAELIVYESKYLQHDWNIGGGRKHDIYQDEYDDNETTVQITSHAASTRVESKEHPLENAELLARIKERLSPFEYAAMWFSAQGESNPEIARRLDTNKESVRLAIIRGQTKARRVLLSLGLWDDNNGGIE